MSYQILLNKSAHASLKKNLNDWKKVNHSLISLMVIKFEEEKGKTAFLLFTTKQFKGLFQLRKATLKRVSVSKVGTAF